MVKKVTKSRILLLYTSNYDRKYYLRELASLLDKSHQTIKPYVESLAKDGILTKNERKNVIEYGLNFKDERVYDYLVISEKERLMERLGTDAYLKALFEKLSLFFGKNTFVIFGSAVDRIKKGSDIDLLVIGRQDVSRALTEFEDIYNREIHKVQVARLGELSKTLVREVYKKHLVINSTEQVVRFFGGLHEQNQLV